MSDSAMHAATPAQLDPEDAARAQWYAFLGRLFYEAPDPMLLAEMCQDSVDDAGAEEGTLAQGWRALRRAAKSAYPVKVKQEYDALFVGVGKAEITPYTSHFVRGVSPERHLVRLRDQLGAWALARRDAAFEAEDHVSGVCDVMRFLIETRRPLSEQRLFFNEFVYPGLTGFLDALTASPNASFYLCVASLARAFLNVEKDALDMEED